MTLDKEKSELKKAKEILEYELSLSTKSAASNLDEIKNENKRLHLEKREKEEKIKDLLKDGFEKNNRMENYQEINRKLKEEKEKLVSNITKKDEEHEESLLQHQQDSKLMKNKMQELATTNEALTESKHQNQQM